MQGNIFEIKRFAVHDGDGIRTTVFFKGCSLKCIWCHNPEGIAAKPQLSYLKHKCVACGRCALACPNGAHTVDENGHRFDREKCTACGACVNACLYKCLTLYGQQVDVDTLLPELLEDKDFYDTSGGGVTLSGGECLLQADFCAELLKKLKEHGVNTAVDTCGFCAKNAIDKVLPYTDVFLYDLKAADSEVHKKGTGQNNEIILQNLSYIDEQGKQIEVRIPYIPNYSKAQLAGMAKILKKLKNLRGVRVLRYHAYAATKYGALDMENTLPTGEVTDEELAFAEEFFRQQGIKILK